jgi:hypothetical protein
MVMTGLLVPVSKVNEKNSAILICSNAKQGVEYLYLIVWR